jgi:hypothetical protein
MLIICNLAADRCSMKNEILFYSLVALSLLLSRLPYIGKFVRVTNTLIHESGHAVMALFTSGSVVSVDLFSDTSGNAVTRSSYLIGKILVALAGYFSSSLAALVLFYFLKAGYHSYILYALCAVAAINLLLWVRNAYGIVWLLLFIGVIAGSIYLKNDKLIYGLSVVFSGVVLWESLTTAIVILYLSAANPKQAGDAKNLKEFTRIPAVLWGLLFAAQAALAFYLVLKLFFSLPF